MLEFVSSPDSLGSRFTQPVMVLAASRIEEVIPVIEAAEAATQAGLYAAGFISYEAAPAFDAAMTVRTDGDLPLAWFGLFSGREPACKDIRDVSGELTGFDFASDRAEWSISHTLEEYSKQINALRNEIAAGNVYQVNHTLRLRSQPQEDGYSWWRALCGSTPPPYAAYLNLDRFEILSLSPELFFRLDGNRIVTRPMKGTRPRGRWLEEDLERSAELAASVKDRAENLMIVDLLRNDLGRVAQFGTVQVDRLFEIERYPTVHQMTSTISAQVRDKVNYADLFRALFPCGSVTGAPKISAVKLIAAMESEPRQIYCGAIGVMAPGRRCEFNVAIRTILVDRQAQTAVYGSGGGITWDSNAPEEYEEIRVKTAVLGASNPAFELLETMRLEAGAYFLEERHLDRVCDSASYFDIPVQRERVQQALLDYAAANADGIWRVRLLIDRSGSARLEGSPLTIAPDAAYRVSPAHSPVSSADRFLYHKTTHRTTYNLHRAAVSNVDEVLLWNERGEITEFTTGNLVAQIAGRRYTPPVSCGVLPGTMRAELLERGEIEERVIRREELAHCEEIWFINSVRGWIRVTMAEGRVSAA